MKAVNLLRRYRWVVLVMLLLAVLLLVGGRFIFKQRSQLADIDEALGGGLSPLTGVDFEQDRATLDVYRVEPGAGSSELVGLRYSYINRTPDTRGLAWGEMTLVSASGEQGRCWGDDSVPIYEAPPGRHEGYVSCELMGTGPYSFYYDEIKVDEISAQEIRLSTELP